MLTVIIPTRNRAHLLASVLESLTRQTLSNDHFEVLVIDNGSKDNTVVIVQKYSALLGNIQYYYEPVPGLHVGRHRGMLEAKNDILVFADDDIEALPTWLESIQEAFLSPDVAMVGGNNYPDFQGEVPTWLQKLWDRPSMGGQELASLSVLKLPEGRREFSPDYVWGCNFSIRKQVLLDAGGFHPDGMPAELIRFRGDGESHVSGYVKKHNLRCIFDSRASVYHAVTSERMTFDYFRQRSFNQGISYSYACLRNPSRFGTSTSSLLNIFRRLFGPLYHFMKQDQERDPEIRELLALMHKGHQEGFKYHQQMYQEYPEVKNWVHKLTYY